MNTLAGAGCSEDTADFPSVDGKVDVFEGDDPFLAHEIDLAQITNLNDRPVS